MRGEVRLHLVGDVEVLFRESQALPRRIGELRAAFTVRLLGAGDLGIPLPIRVFAMMSCGLPLPAFLARVYAARNTSIS